MSSTKVLNAKYLELASKLSDRPEGGFGRSDGVRETKYYWWEHENLPGDSLVSVCTGIGHRDVGRGSRQ